MLLKALTLACMLHGPDSYLEYYLAGTAGAGTEASRLSIKVMDRLRGSEQIHHFADGPLALQLPYGYSCTVSEGKGETDAPAYTMTCESHAKDRTQLIADCAKPADGKPVVKVWDGENAMGMTAVSVALVCLL